MSVARLPRIGTLPRLLLSILLVALAATAAEAQSCTITYYGPSALCTPDPVTAMVYQPSGGGSWTSVTWEITGGQFNLWSGGTATTTTGEQVAFSSNGSGPVTLTIRGTTSTGCSTPDTVVTLPLQDPPVLTISAPTDSCSGNIQTASVLPPADGNWYNVNWTIDGGYFWPDNSANTGETVQFVPFGEPTTLTANAQHSSFCQVAQATATVAKREPDAPVITAPTEMCMNTMATATVGPPSEGSWAQLSWTIEGGYFVTATYNYVTSIQNTGEPVTITPSWPGPMIIRAYGRTTTECWAPQGETTVTLRQPAAPVITAPSVVCPYSPSTASISAPEQGTWTAVYWQISNGTFRDQYGNQVTSLQNTGQPVTFEVGTGMTATISAGGQDSTGCGTPVYGEVTVTSRDIGPAQISAPLEVCPNTPSTATIAPPSEGTWSRVLWWINNGYFVDQYGNRVTSIENTGQPVTFEVSYGSVANITAGAQDSLGCWSSPSSGVYVSNRLIGPAQISAPLEVCPNTPSTATIAPPSEGTWSRVLWWINNGSFVDQYGNRVNSIENTGQPVTFEVSYGSVANISAGAQDSFGCWSGPSSGVNVSNRLIGPAVLSAPLEVCPNTPSTATIAPPSEGGTWSRVMWWINNGYFVDQFGNRVNSIENTGQPVTFEVSYGSVANISAGAQDSFGCWSGPSSGINVSNRAIGPAVVSAPLEVCPGTPATATVAPPAQGTWARVQWWITGGSFVDQFGNRVNSIENTGQPVTFEVSPEAMSATISAGAQDSFGCWSAPSSGVNVSPRRVSAPVVTAPAALCPSTPATASISAPAEGTWVNAQWWISNGWFVDQNGNHVSSLQNDGAPVTFEVSGGGPVQIDVAATDNLGCIAAPAHAYVSLATTPTPQVSVSTQSACLYTPATATVTNAADYTSIVWSIAGNGVIDGSNTGATVTFTANGPGAVTLTATGTSACGVASTDAYVAVNATSEPSITSSQAMPFCRGTAVTLTASAGASWLWSTGATTQSIVITTGGNYSVSITDANGCVRETSFNATEGFNQQVNVSAGGPTTFCEGGSVTLTPDVDQPGATWLWSNGATTRAISVSQSGTYNVTVTYGSGCSSTSAPVTVTVTPLPEAAITADNNAVCNTSTGLRLDATAGADSYLWSTGQTTSSINVFQPGDYTVTVTKNGCSKTSAPFSVVPAVYPSEMPIPTEYWVRACPNGDTTASITNPGAFARLEWTIDNGQIVGPNDQASVTFRTTANTVVRVRGYSATGCSYTNSVNVLTGLPPSDFSAPARICLGNSTRSDILYPETGATYSWSIQGGTILLYYQDRPGIAWRPDSAAPVTITATATRNGCSTTTTKTVQVDELDPSMVRITAPARVCTVSGHTATANDAGEGATYTWYMISGGTITSPTNQRTITYDVDPNAPYTRLTLYTSKGSCGWYISHDTIYDVPQATITASRTTLCPGGSATLTANAAAGYLWSNGATTQSINVTQPGNYTVTTTSQGGCSTTSSPVAIAAETASAPVIDLSPSAVCWSQTDVTAVVANASQFTSIAWATNATATTPLTGNYLAVRRAAGPAVYWVEATGTTASGCQLTTRVQIPVAPIPDTTITSSAATFCNGGTYTLSVPDAGAGATYQWRVSHGTIVSGGNSTTMTLQAADNGSPLSVWCDITEALGCVSSGEKVIAVSTAPTVDITADATSCVGKTNSASVQRVDGATYQWTVTGADVLTPTNDYMIYFRATSAGTVTLQATVTLNGCSGTDTHTVNVEQYTSTITAGGPTTFCEGGFVQLTADGPANAAWYWSNGLTGRSILVNNPGSYYVDMTLNGCTVRSNSIAVTVNPVPPTPEITASGPLTFCEGGSVTLTAPDGYTYLWSNGATTRSITVDETNGYYVTVTNEFGCFANSNPVSVTVYDKPGTINTWTYGPTTFCDGGSVMIVASGEYGYNFLWSTGETTQSITVRQSGSYTVTVTNANGCTNTSAPVVVTVLPVPAKPVITASGPTTFCFGGNVTLSAPEGYSTYTWSNGMTSREIFVPYSGVFTVTATNADGCSATSDPVTVQVHNPPTFNWTYYGQVCAGVESSREIAASPDATSYDWSITNGTITRTEGSRVYFIANANPVTLTATVTNGNGCTYTDSMTLPVNSAATPTISASGALAFCSGGSVTLTSSAASSYVWSNGATTQWITVSQPGEYTVTITDANGCGATSAATVVTVHDTPATPQITADGALTFCEGGSVTLSAPAGYSYLWSNGATGPSIVVTDSGSFTVRVTDGNGCSATSAATVVTVNDKPDATIQITGSLTFCDGDSVTLTAPAGTGYTYAWSNGSTDRSITVYDSGSFWVTVTTAAGCSTTSDTKVVTANDKPVAEITGATSFCQGSSTTLTATSGAGYTYTWSNGSHDPSITVTAGGEYWVTVTNPSGCSTTSATTTVTMNVPPQTPQITWVGSLSFCDGGSVRLSAPAGYTYVWSNGATSREIDVYDSGIFTVQITDANGCSATSAAVTVTENPLPEIPQITVFSGSLALCPGASVTLRAPAGYSYSWSNGAITRDITVSAPGQYSVTVTDGNGCSRQSAPATVTTNPATAITVQPASITMPRGVTRTLSVTATGTATLQYQWYEGNTGDTTKPITTNGGTTSTLTIGPYTKKATLRFWVRVSSSTCTTSTANSFTATVTVN